MLRRTREGKETINFNLLLMEFDDLEAGLLGDDEPFAHRVSSGEVGLASNENSFAWSSPYISLSFDSASSESIQPASGPPVHVPTSRDVEQWVQRHIDDANERFGSARRADEQSARVLRRRKGRWEVVLPLALLPTSSQRPQSAPMQSNGHSRSIYLGKFATLDAAGGALCAAVHHALGAAFPASHWGSLNGSPRVASSFTATTAQSAGFAVARNLRSSGAWAASPSRDTATRRGGALHPPLMAPPASKSSAWHSLCAHASDSSFPEVFSWLQPGPWPLSATRVRRQSTATEPTATESQSSSVGSAGLELWMRIRKSLLVGGRREETGEREPEGSDGHMRGGPTSPPHHHYHPHCVVEGSPSPPRHPVRSSGAGTVGFAPTGRADGPAMVLDVLGLPTQAPIVLRGSVLRGSPTTLRWHLPAVRRFPSHVAPPDDDRGGEGEAWGDAGDFRGPASASSDTDVTRAMRVGPQMASPLGEPRKGALRRLAGWQADATDQHPSSSSRMMPVALPSPPDWEMPSTDLCVAEFVEAEPLAARGQLRRCMHLRVPVGWADASLFGQSGVAPLRGGSTSTSALTGAVSPAPLDAAAVAADGADASNSWCVLLESASSATTQWFAPACAWEEADGRRAVQLVALPPTYSSARGADTGGGIRLEENGSGIQLAVQRTAGGGAAQRETVALLHWSAKQTRLWRALAPTSFANRKQQDARDAARAEDAPASSFHAEGRESDSVTATNSNATSANGKPPRPSTKPRARRKNPLRFRQMQATLPRFRDVPATTRPSAARPAPSTSSLSTAACASSSSASPGARKPVSVTTVTGVPGMRVFDWQVAEPTQEVVDKVAETSGEASLDDAVWLRLTVWAPLSPIQAATLAFLQWESQCVHAEQATSS